MYGFGQRKDILLMVRYFAYDCASDKPDNYYLRTHIWNKSNINTMNQNKIPEGLVKCEKCGEYKGSVKEKDLGPPDYLGFETENGEGFLDVSCLCEGILCPKCKKNRIHRPISNSYDAETNNIVHYPYFIAMAGCKECRGKINMSEEKEKNKKNEREIRVSPNYKENDKSEAEIVFLPNYEIQEKRQQKLVAEQRKTHLLLGFAMTATGFFIVNYFDNSFLPFLGGAILFWFGSTGLISGLFAPANYLLLMLVPRREWSISEKEYIDKVQNRLDGLYWKAVFVLAGVALLIKFLFG